MKRAVAFLGMLMLLVACAQLGTQGQKIEPGPDEKAAQLGYAYVTLAELRTTTAQLVRQKQVTPEQARHIQQLADQARVVLDTAMMAHFEGKGDPAQALKMIEVILHQAQVTLQGYQDSNNAQRKSR